jgi:DNA-binding XRE family transcriptional regulator
MTNPIRRARDSYGLTQKALADLLGVTPQVVINAEAGLFNSVPDSFLSVLHVTQESYKEWVYQKRRENSVYFEAAVTHMGWAVFKTSVSNTNRGFCRCLVFQPSILREYEKYKRSKPLLAEALSDVGLDTSQLKELKFNG